MIDVNEKMVRVKRIAASLASITEDMHALLPFVMPVSATDFEAQIGRYISFAEGLCEELFGPEPPADGGDLPPTDLDEPIPYAPTGVVLQELDEPGELASAVERAWWVVDYEGPPSSTPQLPIGVYGPHRDAQVAADVLGHRADGGAVHGVAVFGTRREAAARVRVAG